jgi:hypothetical protein
MALNFPANPVDGQIYENFAWSDSVNAWQFFSPLTLNEIEDVTAPAPVGGDILFYNGNEWINSSPEDADLSDKDLSALFWMYA